jgi:hypothetical protein
MQAYKLPDGTLVVPGQQFQINDQKYPSNWLALASQQEIADAGIAVEEVPDPPPPPPGPVVVNSRDFRLLFTQEETIAITTASMSNVQLRIFLDDEAAAGEVHMDNPEVIAGIGALVSAGLITQDRADAILAGRKP